MPSFFSINRQRGILIVTVFLLWFVAICFRAVHFEPGNLNAAQQALKGEPTLLNFNMIFISSVAAMVLGLSFTWAIKRFRNKKRKDGDPYERYREPMPTPWTVYLILGLFFTLVIGIIWLARKPSLPENLSHTSGQSALQRPGQTESTPQLFPLPGASENRALAENMLKYLLGPLLLAVLIWIGWRRWKDRPAIFSGEATASNRRFIPLVADSKKGGELPDVVLRCYRDMCCILSSRVPFPKEMTAREFANSCRGAGVQVRDVSRLTELFEKVRYGRHKASLEEQAESIALLEAIEGRHRRPMP